MARSSSVSINFKLALFLITTAFLSVSALYFDLRKQNADLLHKVETLKASQVLLVVPDEQADALSEWLNSHPESIETLIRQGKDKGQQGVNTDQELMSKPLSESSDKKTDNKSSQAIPDNDFSSEEIKTYKLPHGGIRVTTRVE